MPTTVLGTIDSTDITHFIAKFTTDDAKTYSFAGTFEAIVPNLTCRQAVVTFNDIAELASSQNFTGRVGPFDVQLDLDNGPIIKGVLNAAVMSRKLWGTGKWGQD